MATGYSAAISTDADVVKYRPTILKELPTGWSDLSVARAMAYKRVSRDLLASKTAYPNKVEYLARVVDNTQLLDAEVFATIAHFATARMIHEQDHFAMLARKFDKLYSDFWKSAFIQWDETVSVTETDTDVKAMPRRATIERV